MRHPRDILLREISHFFFFFTLLFYQHWRRDSVTFGFIAMFDLHAMEENNKLYINGRKYRKNNYENCTSVYKKYQKVERQITTHRFIRNNNKKKGEERKENKESERKCACVCGTENT